MLVLISIGWLGEEWSGLLAGIEFYRFKWHNSIEILPSTGSNWDSQLTIYNSIFNIFDIKSGFFNIQVTQGTLINLGIATQDDFFVWKQNGLRPFRCNFLLYCIMDVVQPWDPSMSNATF